MVPADCEGRSAAASSSASSSSGPGPANIADILKMLRGPGRSGSGFDVGAIEKFAKNRVEVRLDDCSDRAAVAKLPGFLIESKLSMPLRFQPSFAVFESAVMKALGPLLEVPLTPDEMQLKLATLLGEAIFGIVEPSWCNLAMIIYDCIEVGHASQPLTDSLIPEFATCYFPTIKDLTKMRSLRVQYVFHVLQSMSQDADSFKTFDVNGTINKIAKVAAAPCLQDRLPNIDCLVGDKKCWIHLYSDLLKLISEGGIANPADVDCIDNALAPIRDKHSPDMYNLVDFKLMASVKSSQAVPQESGAVIAATAANTEVKVEQGTELPPTQESPDNLSSLADILCFCDSEGVAEMELGEPVLAAEPVVAAVAATKLNLAGIALLASELQSCMLSVSALSMDIYAKIEVNELASEAAPIVGNAGLDPTDKLVFAGPVTIGRAPSSKRSLPIFRLAMAGTFIDSLRQRR